LSMLNGTISDNGDTGIVADGPTTIVNSTIASNTLHGITNDNGAAVTLVNSIVFGNRQGDCFVAVDTSIASLDGDGSCGANLKADPKPGPRPPSNGGPTPTRALLAGSPAIDGGDNSRCPADDQRHKPRNDGKCDLGSYELAQVTDTTSPVITVPPDITAEA